MNEPWRRALGGADPYEVLGVARDATRDEIIRAHRRLVREVHPDLPAGDAERTKLLHLARDVLLDPLARNDYDRSVADGAWAAAEADPGPAEPMPSGVWDTEDVVEGVGRSPLEPAPPPPEYETIPDDWYDPPPPPYAAYPTYPVHDYPVHPYPPPPYRRESLTLPVIALVSSLLCGPVGLPLSLVSLSRTWRYPSAGRVLSIIAVIFSAITAIWCLGMGGLQILEFVLTGGAY